MVEARSARVIRSESRFVILRAILRRQPVTRQELTAETGLSTATVANIVTELLKAEVIEVDSVGSSTGRPFTRLAIANDRACLVGVDAAETYIAAHAYNLSLEPIGQASIALDERRNEPAYVLQSIDDVVTRALADAGHDASAPAQVGISFPGQVQADTGVSIFAPNWSWHQVNVRELLRSHTKLRGPVHIDNPLKAIAMAELWLNPLAADQLVTLNLGTGVGGAIVRGGKLVTGASNNAGEWGHTTLVMGGRPCRCGRRGCAEAYVGAAGIRQTLIDIAPHHPSAGLGQTEFIHSMIDGLRREEQPFVEVADQVGRHLATLIGNIINAANPEAVLLTGWVFNQLEPWLLPVVRSHLAEEALESSLAGVTVGRLELEGNPVTLGMAIFALEDFLSRLGVPSRVLPAEPDRVVPARSPRRTATVQAAD